MTTNPFTGGYPNFGLVATYQLTSVSIYDNGSNHRDAGAGFECEGSGGVRETIEINGVGANPNLYVAMVGTGFTTYTSVKGGQVMFTGSTYTYAPICSSGILGTNVTTGLWGSTATTVTLQGFVPIGCLHGGTVYSGTEVDTFTLVP